MKIGIPQKKNFTIQLFCIVCVLLLISCSEGREAEIVPVDQSPDPVDDPIEPVNQSPGAVELIAPADASTSVSVFPAFEWSTSTDPDGDDITYELYVTGEDNSETLLYSGPGRSFKSDKRLYTAETYSWKVIATDGKGGSSASPANSFQTRGILFTQVAGKEPFLPVWGASLAVTRGRLFLMGGESGGNISNDVWVSTNGKAWSKLSTTNVFPARRFHTSVSFNDRIWVIGGQADAFSRKNDVWSSANGTDWEAVTLSAGFSPRVAHASVVFDNKIWVVGGYDGGAKNDVWFSPDGLSWTQAASSAPFAARSGHTVAAFNNKLWVIGGYDLNSSDFLNDVWSSPDGTSWTEVTPEDAFSSREQHTSVTFDNKLWVIGGAGFNSNDVWFTADGVAWTKVLPPYSIKAHHASAVFDDKIWIIGNAYAGIVENDTSWYLD